jgi:hypothetical protein
VLPKVAVAVPAEPTATFLLKSGKLKVVELSPTPKLVLMAVNKAE